MHLHFLAYRSAHSAEETGFICHLPAGTRAIVTISPRLASASLLVWPWVACLTAAVFAVCLVEAVKADLQRQNLTQTPCFHVAHLSQAYTGCSDKTEGTLQEASPATAS